MRGPAADDRVGKRLGVLYRHRRSLRRKGRHGVGGVADQREAPRRVQRS